MCLCCNTLQHTCKTLATHVLHTGRRRSIGCLELQIISRKIAINYRAFLREMSYKDKASPCRNVQHVKQYTVTHGNSLTTRLQHTCNTLATHCHTLERTCLITTHFITSNTPAVHFRHICNICATHLCHRKVLHNQQQIDPDCNAT